MRDLASCFSEHVIKVSDSSGSSTQPHSTKNTVSCLYNTTLSTQKHLLITVTWCKNLICQRLLVDVDDNPSHTWKVDTNSWLFWKKKGTRSFESSHSKIDVYWDISAAQYGAGPEPIAGFYVVVITNSQIGLLLGDMSQEAAFKKFNTHTPIAHFFLVARKEYVFGKTLYSTKARFGDNRSNHEILIKCRGEKGVLKDPELSICIDRKKVIHVKRLQWKFRGNQTIFVDGTPVDMMWDVHDWFFNLASGNAVFLFRMKSGVESRMWLEENLLQKEEERIGFSLFIYACKSP